jgi:hypothetical protein
MTSLGAPAAIRWGSDDPTAPLLVLLQGPGDATEKDLAAFGRITELDGVVTAPSAVSVPGARAFLLPPSKLPPGDTRAPESFEPAIPMP